MQILESSLPEAWVKKIFTAMRATYGAAFDRQWECPAGVDAAEFAGQMLAHWGRELRGYQQAPQALAYALDNLPPHPPNLVEFKGLCRRRPDAQQARLPAPDVPPEAMLKAVAAIVKPAPVDGRDWARQLQKREQSGERLTAYQRFAMREAMREAA